MKRKKRQIILPNIGDIIAINKKNLYLTREQKKTSICTSCFKDSCNSYAVVLSRYKDKDSMNYHIQIFFMCTEKIETKNDGNFKIVCNAKI